MSVIPAAKIGCHIHGILLTKSRTDRKPTKEDISMNYILASKSPRRKEILENIGLKFDIVTSPTDETCAEHDPCRYVKALAERKGRAVLNHLRKNNALAPDTLVIASDTVVACDGEILGKPRDRADATRMLEMFSGKTHIVVSGIALLSESHTAVDAEITEVVFDKIPEHEIDLYTATDEPYDKAGAYAIQGFASLWIKGIRGDYFNVVGFPVKCFANLLKRDFSVSLADEIGK